MQALSGILGSIGGGLSKGASIASPIMSILGMIRNISGTSAQDKVMQQQAAYFKQMAELANNPAALAAKIAAVKQPLSAGLVADVMNPVQAQLAERGLSASPAIATQIASQSLAPFEQNSQQMAINAVMQMLGLPISAGAAVNQFKPSDTSGFWKQFLPGGGDSQVTSGAGVPFIGAGQGSFNPFDAPGLTGDIPPAGSDIIGSLFGGGAGGS